MTLNLTRKQRRTLYRYKSVAYFGLVFWNVLKMFQFQHSWKTLCLRCFHWIWNYEAIRGSQNFAVDEADGKWNFSKEFLCATYPRWRMEIQISMDVIEYEGKHKKKGLRRIYWYSELLHCGNKLLFDWNVNIPTTCKDIWLTKSIALIFDLGHSSFFLFSIYLFHLVSLYENITPSIKWIHILPGENWKT